MFKEWRQVVQDLNKNRTKENVEKAEKLKKKYRIIGRILKIIGLILTIASVGSFITFSIIDNENFIPVIIISGLLFPISFGVFGFGVTYKRISTGIDIILNQKPIIQMADNNRCPYCGDIINIGEIFCSKCGHKLEKVCPKCGYSNDPSNNYCEKCGEALY